MNSKTDMAILPHNTYVYGSTEAKEHVMQGRRVVGGLLQQLHEFLSLILHRKDLIENAIAMEPDDYYDSCSYFAPFLDFMSRFNENEPGTIIVTVYQSNLSALSIIITPEHDIKASTIHDFWMKYTGGLKFQPYVLDGSTKMTSLEKYYGYQGFRCFPDSSFYVIDKGKRSTANPDPKYTVLEFLDIISDLDNPETFEMALMNEIVLKDVLLSCILSSSYPHRISFRSNVSDGMYKLYRHLRYSCYLLKKHSKSTANS